VDPFRLNHGSLALVCVHFREGSDEGGPEKRMVKHVPVPFALVVLFEVLNRCHALPLTIQSYTCVNAMSKWKTKVIHS
jgi:hypothetical protein